MSLARRIESIARYSAYVRIVVLISGSGTLLQALIEASADPKYGVTIAAVGADRPGIAGLDRAKAAGIDTFVHKLSDFDTREQWDKALTETVREYQPDLVVSAGFLKLFGPHFLANFDQRAINTHPSLLPAFPGIHAPQDALNYGVRFTGCTLFIIDSGVDTGQVLDQRVVPVLPDDTVDTLHERIKVQERELLVTVVRGIADGSIPLKRKASTP
ncbi:MAG: phosphoribosylglycinamide formyltransferase [Corynebacteriales bacterium]|nr:phosphoribosylglycinamide formyltransferase [Mycobacteriales bacterium]